VAATAFPSIAEKATDQREKMQWQARAAAFQATDITSGMDFDIGSTVNADRQSPTDAEGNHMRTLAYLHASEDIFDATIRDSLQTAKLVKLSRGDILDAKSNATQYRCLAEAVYYEARSEPRSGQKAVAEVVLNRVKSKHFPNTVCGVVYQGAERTTGCQFSFTCDGSTLKEPRGKAWQRSQDVAAMALTGGFKPFTDRSTHYHTFDVNPHWSSSLKMTKTVGTHKFYRFKPRRRTTPNVAVLTAPPS